MQAASGFCFLNQDGRECLRPNLVTADVAVQILMLLRIADCGDIVVIKIVLIYSKQL